MTRRSGIFILTMFIAVVLLASCSPLFTHVDKKQDTSSSITIKINGAYPENRSGLPGPDDITGYKISILKQSDGTLVQGPDDIVGDTYEAELDCDMYRIVLSCIDESSNNWTVYGAPSLIGIQNFVHVTAGSNTEVTLSLVYLMLPENGDGILEDETWFTGVLPEPNGPEGIPFAGWLDEDLQTVTELPDTTYISTSDFPFISVQPFFSTTYYVSTNGGGNGSSGDSPLSISEAIEAINNLAVLDSESEDTQINVPTIILTENVTMPTDTKILGSFWLKGCDYAMFGSGDGDDARILFVGDGNLSHNQPSCIIQDVVFDGQDCRQGIANYGDMTLINCTVQNCYLEKTVDEQTHRTRGAAIFNAHVIDLKYCTIQDCTLEGTGSAAGIFSDNLTYYGDRLRVTLDHTTVARCNAIPPEYYETYTGGISLCNYSSEIVSELYLISSTIDECSASHYGGISLSYGDCKLYVKGSCTISNCSAEDGDGGGLALDSSEFEMDADAHLEFYNCTATEKGGAFLCYRPCDLTNMTFTSCSAGESGGAVHITSYATGDIHVDHCDFSDCSVTGSGGKGGAIYATYSSGSGSVIVTDTTISGCNADDGPSMYVNKALKINGHDVNSSGEYGLDIDISPETDNFPV